MARVITRIKGFLADRGQRKLRRELIDKVEKEIDEGVRMFQRYTATWEKNKPTFFKEIKVNERKISYEIKHKAPILKGSTAGLTAFKMLDEGTSVRRVAVSRDWQSKTYPRHIESGPGRGKVSKPSNKLAFPGIKARKIEETVKEEMDPKISKAIREAVRDGLKSFK